MTMTARTMDWLIGRGLDVELADKLGLESVIAGLGEAILIPTLRGDRVVAKKYRLFDGMKRDPDQRWVSAKGGDVCFWNEDVLRHTSLDGQALVITEGHWDAITALQCGFPRTVSVPNGSPPPARPGARKDVDRLADSERYAFVREIMPLITKERFPLIILATDADGPGEQLMHDLSVQLGRYRCRFVSYPDDCKDLNDVLIRHGAQGVVEAINGAQPIAIPGVFKMSKLPPLAPETIYDIGGEGRRLQLTAEHYRMRLGDVTVLTGVPGYGKSTWLNDVVFEVCDHYDIAAAWGSFEQSPQRDHKRAMRKWFDHRTPDFMVQEEDFDEWIDRHNTFLVPAEDEDATLDWVLDVMEGAVVRDGVKIIVLDPWNEIVHRREPGESETDYTGYALRTLKRFAKKFQVHIIIVAHPAKLQKVNGKYLMPSLYDISGSSNFYNKCDVGVIVHREDKDVTIVKFQKVKYIGLIGRPGELSVSFNGVTARFVENERLA